MEKETPIQRSHFKKLKWMLKEALEEAHEHHVNDIVEITIYEEGVCLQVDLEESEFCDRWFYGKRKNRLVYELIEKGWTVEKTYLKLLESVTEALMEKVAKIQDPNLFHVAFDAAELDAVRAAVQLRRGYNLTIEDTKFKKKYGLSKELVEKIAFSVRNKMLTEQYKTIPEN